MLLMLKFIKTLSGWKISLLALIILMLAFLALGQAITFAWLSGFPEQAPRIEVLKIKFWFYMIAALALVIVDSVIIYSYLKFKRRSS